MNSNFNFVFSKLKKMCGLVLKNVNLKEFSSFKIGGKCKIWVEPESLEEIVRIITFLNEKQIKYMVVGNCTNLLFSSGGYDGVVVRLGAKYSHLDEFGTTLIASAGLGLSALAYRAGELGLSGLEDAFGIPGSVAGALVMNASAYGFKMENLVTSVVAIKNGKITMFTASECGFGYRKSIFQDPNIIVLKVEFKLKKGKKSEILEHMAQIKELRASRQPLNQPSAGCVFKNPDGVSVARLIEDAGLKGYAIGGAMVSPKHSNFIVNAGSATSDDVLNLIDHIKKIIKQDYNIDLQTEVIYVE